MGAALGLEVLNGGEVFRAMAVESGMGLAEFGAYAATHPEVDVELDSRLAARARTGDVLIEARLAGWILRNERLDGLRVWLSCDDTIRAERVASREAIPVSRALQENAEREKVEHERYLALYGVDLRDLSIYHQQLDTGMLDADQVAEHIVDAARSA